MRFSSDEKILHEAKPDRKLIGTWFFNKSVVHGIVGGALMTLICSVLVAIFDDELTMLVFFQGEQFLLKLALVLAVTITALSYLYVRALINSITYYITDRRCIWTGGILKKVEHSTSFIKITDVEQSRNLLEQLLGIATVNLFTPGTSSMHAGIRTLPELKFEGLTLNSDEIAETVNESIRQHGSKPI